MAVEFQIKSEYAKYSSDNRNVLHGNTGDKMINVVGPHSFSMQLK